MESHLSIFETPEQLAIAAAERFVKLATDEGDRFAVALSGGTTPKRVYELLVTEQFSRQIDWTRIHLFFGDERCVPPTGPDSNYRMVHDALISKIPIPPANVHRIKAEYSATEAASNYERELRAFFVNPDSTLRARRPRSQFTLPRFDLVLLGMGEDGHTASLFPNSEALNENSRWVVATKQTASSQDRITLTLPVINHAANILFLVTGQSKAQRLREVLRPNEDTKPLPAQLIRPSVGTVHWLVDAAAASLVREQI